ncbi:MAG: Na+/H+ antiporter subunit E [Candidatus Marinimicrobia bacterium]|nr:Na+/H+ antiporter subunit E [Candidatus Neomarinimicrobiota bacterium]
MSLRTKSKILVFFLALVCYLALTSFTDYQEIIAGIAAALIVTLLAGGLLLQTEGKKNLFKRSLKAVEYMFRFLWEMTKANLHVAYLVLHPNLPIKPGIVKIKSSLKNESAITVLANSITLTPGTLTIDYNEKTGELYIHWIDVKSVDEKKDTEIIGAKFENLLKEVFE